VGITSVVVRISNPGDRRRGIEAEMLVDSGAIFSVVPATELHALAIEPEHMERFSLADGTSVTRPVGIARFEWLDEAAAHP
jgi:hypothetical protein